MTSTSGYDDDAVWRRPAAPPGASADAPPTPSGAGTTPSAPPRYTGPPPSTPPPPGWRPPVVVQPAPPRELPAQDPAELDSREQAARTLTYGIAMIAGAIVLILTLIVCGRLLF